MGGKQACRAYVTDSDVSKWDEAGRVAFCGWILVTLVSGVEDLPEQRSQHEDVAFLGADLHVENFRGRPIHRTARGQACFFIFLLNE